MRWALYDNVLSIHCSDGVGKFLLNPFYTTSHSSCVDGICKKNVELLDVIFLQEKCMNHLKNINININFFLFCLVFCKR